MNIDFITIKQTFRNLNKLKVKEVILPYKEYDMLRDQVVLHCDDGGSWNYKTSNKNMMVEKKIVSPSLLSRRLDMAERVKRENIM